MTTELLTDFETVFNRLMQTARASGAVPEDTEDNELARCVLQIAAENFRPVSDRNKRLLANLRHFI